MSSKHIQTKPMAGHLGVEIAGVDLSKPLDGVVFDELHEAFLAHAVIVFRDQQLSREDEIAFGRRFGELDIHPIAIGMEEHPEMPPRQCPERAGLHFRTQSQRHRPPGPIGARKAKGDWVLTKEPCKEPGIAISEPEHVTNGGNAALLGHVCGGDGGG